MIRHEGEPSIIEQIDSVVARHEFSHHGISGSHTDFGPIADDIAYYFPNGDRFYDDPYARQEPYPEQPPLPLPDGTYCIPAQEVAYRN